MNFQCQTLSINDDPDFGCTISFSESTPEIDRTKSWPELMHPTEKYLFLQVSYPEDQDDDDDEIDFDDVAEGDEVFEVVEEVNGSNGNVAHEVDNADSENYWYTVESSEMDFEFNQRDGIIIYKLNRELIEISWGWASITIGLNISEEKLAELKNILKERFGSKVFLMPE